MIPALMIEKIAMGIYDARREKMLQAKSGHIPHFWGQLGETTRAQDRQEAVRIAESLPEKSRSDERLIKDCIKRALRK